MAFPEPTFAPDPTASPSPAPSPTPAVSPEPTGQYSPQDLQGQFSTNDVAGAYSPDDIVSPADVEQQHAQLFGDEKVSHSRPEFYKAEYERPGEFWNHFWDETKKLPQEFWDTVKGVPSQIAALPAKAAQARADVAKAPPMTPEEMQRTNLEVAAGEAEEQYPSMNLLPEHPTIQQAAEAGTAATKQSVAPYAGAAEFVAGTGSNLIADLINATDFGPEDASPEARERYHARQANVNSWADWINNQGSVASREVAKANGEDPDATYYQWLHALGPFLVPLPVELGAGEKMAGAISNMARAGNVTAKALLPVAGKVAVAGVAGAAALKLGINPVVLEVAAAVTGIPFAKSVARTVVNSIKNLDVGEVAKSAREMFQSPGGLDAAEKAARAVSEDINHSEAKISSWMEKLTDDEKAELAETRTNLDGEQVPLKSPEDLSGTAKKIRAEEESVNDLNEKLEALYQQTKTQKLWNATSLTAANLIGNTAVGAGVGGLLGAVAAPSGYGAKGFVGGTEAGAGLGLATAPLATYAGMHGLRVERGNDAFQAMGEQKFRQNPPDWGENVDQAMKDHITQINGLATGLGKKGTGKQIFVLRGNNFQQAVETKLLGKPTGIEAPVGAPQEGLPPEALSQQGIPAEAAKQLPNGFVGNDGNLYLNGDRLGTGVAGHELSHPVIDEFFGQLLHDTDPALFDQFAQAYDTARGFKFGPEGEGRFVMPPEGGPEGGGARLTSPLQLQKERWAEVGNLILRNTPTGLFYGGEKGGDIAARVLRGWANHLFPDHAIVDPQLKAPITNSDIEQFKQRIFQIGERARIRRFLATGEAPPSAAAPPPTGGVVGGVGGGAGGAAAGAPQTPKGPQGPQEPVKPQEPQGPAAPAAPSVQHPDYDAIRTQAEDAVRQKLAGSKAKDVQQRIERAGIEAAAQAHAKAVGPDSPLITWRTDKYGKTSISGTEADASDPFHQMLIERAGLNKPEMAQAKTNLNDLEANMGRAIAVDYSHAPEETGKEVTRGGREGERAAAPVEERVAGEAARTKLTKSYVPTGMTYYPKANAFVVNGFSPDKLLNNANIVINWANDKGITTYGGVNDPLLVEHMQQLTENHQNGFAGNGKPIKGTALTPVEQTQGYKPHVIPRDYLDQLNVMMGNDTAKTGAKGLSPEQAEKQTLAKQNSPYFDPATGETNRFREQLGKEAEKLEPVYETLRPELIDAVRQAPVDDTQTIRPSGFTGDRAQLGLRGLPRSDFVSAGLMPATEGVEGVPRGEPERGGERQLMPGTQQTPEQLDNTLREHADEGSTLDGEDLFVDMNVGQMLDHVSGDMYKSPVVETLTKELLQNSKDATMASGSTSKNPKKISITLDPAERRVTYTDSGEGMNREVIHKAFFTVGGSFKTTKPEDTSGGLGLAKMVALYATKGIDLETVKDGVKYRVNATVDQIKDARKKELGGKGIPLKIREEPTSEPNGTTVSVTVPETYKDPNGEEQQNYWPAFIEGSKDYNGMTSFLKKPFLAPIEVEFNGQILPIGVHDTKWQHDNTFHFKWGDINLHIDPTQRTDNPTIGVLSAGLHQFTLYPYEVYGGNYKDKALPYNMVLDVRSKVKGSSPLYPFNLQREGFRGTIEKDVKAMYQFLKENAVRHKLGEAQETFSSMEQLPEVDVTKNLTAGDLKRITQASEQEKPTPYTPKKVTDVHINPKDVVIHYQTGETETVPRDKYVEESFAPEKKIDFEQTKIDVSGLDPQKPYLHNNTNVDYSDIKGYAPLATQVGNALIKYMREWARMGGAYEQLGDTTPLGGWFGGISFDKGYRGLNMMNPFRAIWFNLGNLSHDAMFSPRTAAAETIHIFNHELSHVDQRNEGGGFTSELATNHARLVKHDIPFAKFEKILERVYTKHWDALNEINNRHTNYNTKNRAASFKSAAALGAEPRGAETTGEGVPQVDVSGDERVQEQGRPSAGGVAAPDQLTGSIGDVLAGQAAQEEGAAPYRPMQVGDKIGEPVQPHTYEQYLKARAADREGRQPMQGVPPETPEPPTEKGTWEEPGVSPWGEGRQLMPATERGRTGSGGVWDTDQTAGHVDELAKTLGVDPKKRFYEQKPENRQKITDYYKWTGQAQYMPATEGFDPEFKQPEPVSDDVLRAALSSNKVPFVGANRDLPAGTPVSSRIDIPSFLRSGIYAQTVHAPKIGKNLGYDSIVHMDGPITFTVRESTAEKIKNREVNKAPIAATEGKYNPDRTLPADINDLSKWTPLGFDPYQHSYFYDKTSDAPVKGADEAIHIGNTVYVKNPVYGNPSEFRYMPATQTDTPAFKKWFEDSKVVDEKDKPLVVYHGTTHDFGAFDPEKANLENDWGKAAYFSNNPKDIEHNYAGMGPDLTGRVERRAENIHDEAIQLSPEELMDKFGLTKSEADLIRSEPKYGSPEYNQRREIYRGLAAKEIAGTHGGATMPVFLKMSNPLELGGTKEPHWSLEYDEETGEEAGELVKLHSALLDATSYFDGADAQKAFSEAIEKVGEDGKASDYIDALRHSEGLAYATDEKGDLATTEILRQMVDNMGYDGIIDRLVNKKFGSERQVGKSMEGMTPDTVHYVAFAPTQIKSATANRGTFDPWNPDISLMPATADPEELKSARLIAAEAHAGQVRKITGEPYINHPLAVSASVPKDLRAAAVLHDVLEDTELTKQDLIDKGISPKTADLVEDLTRRPDESYADMIDRISKSPAASAIKLSDLRNNIKNLPIDDSLRKRYSQAIVKLQTAVHDMPQLMPSTHPDAVADTAIQTPDGKVWTGDWANRYYNPQMYDWKGARIPEEFEGSAIAAIHSEIRSLLEEEYSNRDLAHSPDGWVTNSKEFLDRNQAYERALELKQISAEKYAERLPEAKHLETYAFEDTQLPEETHAVLSDPTKELDLSKDENFHAVNTIVPVKGSDSGFTMVDTDGRRFVGKFDPSIKVWPTLEDTSNVEGFSLMPATMPVSSTPGVTIVKGLKELRGEELRPEAPRNQYYRTPGELAQAEGDPKTVKGQKYRVQTYVMYSAASDSSGVMNACAHATRGPGGCVMLCLVHNGQGGMPDGTLARINKTRFFHYDKPVFMSKLDREITRNKAKVRSKDFEYAIRLNGTSDIKWENEKVGELPLMEKHSDVQFYDYTKYPEDQRELPPNYDITYSYTGDPISIERSNAWAKNKKMNTAVVFEGGMPAEFLGRPVIDGDVSDLRYKDPKGVIVGLHAKGDKALAMAREGTTGFIYKTPAEDVAIPYVYPQTKAALLKKHGEGYINEIKDGLNPKYPTPKVNDLVWKRGDPFLGLNEGKTAPDPENPGVGVMTPEMQRQYEAAQEAKKAILAKEFREKIESQTPWWEKPGFDQPEFQALKGFKKGGIVLPARKSLVGLGSRNKTMKGLSKG